MQKRGQIAIWFIVGIIILTTVILGFVFKDNILDFLRDKQLISSLAIPKEVEPVNNFVLDCVKKTADESLATIGLSGGYYGITTSSNQREIPYYYLDGQLRIPSRKIIERSLSNYFNENLKYCIQNFNQFNNSFDIKSSKLSSNVKISDQQVVFDIGFASNLSVGIYNQVSNEVEFIYTDNQYLLLEEPYRFIVALRFKE